MEEDARDVPHRHGAAAFFGGRAMVWDSAGDLVAQSRRLCGVRPGRRAQPA